MQSSIQMQLIPVNSSLAYEELFMLCSCAEAARGACRGSAAPYRPWLWRARCQPRPDRGRTTTSGTRRFGRAGARAVSERGRARVRGGHGLVGAGRGRGWRGREKMTGKTLSMLPSIESSLIRSAAKPRQTERKRFRATQRAWTLDSRPPPRPQSALAPIAHTTSVRKVLSNRSHRPPECAQHEPFAW